MNAQNDQPPQEKHEGYITCTCCGAILGYKTKVNDILMGYIYAYAPRAPRVSLHDRRVNTRIMSGDICCPHCGEWRFWCSDIEKK